MEGTIIALYSSDREVLWFEEGDMDDNDQPVWNLHNRMATWLADKKTFTILEYHPNGWDNFNVDISTRCAWWDEQLREQGYDIYTEQEQ